MVGGVCVEEGREEWKSNLMCWALVYAVVSECVYVLGRREEGRRVLVVKHLFSNTMNC